MKKIIFMLKIIFFFSWIFFSFQLYAEPDRVSDNNITNEIKNKIKADKIVADLEIKIITHNGIVNLAGEVDTKNEVSKIIEIAESTAGVKEVDSSQLTAKESSQSLTDTMITAKVKGRFLREKLFGEKDIAAITINVETVDGVVYLTGIANKAQAENAVLLAQSVKGVKRVESKIVVNNTY